MKKVSAFAVTLLGMGKVIARTTPLQAIGFIDRLFIIARNEDGSANNAATRLFIPSRFINKASIKHIGTILAGRFRDSDALYGNS